MAVLQLDRLLEYRIRPVDVFEPVTGRCRREEMAAHFREEVARHLDAGSLSERRGAQPAGDAADALRIGHRVVAGTGGERLRHLLGSHEVLAELNRGCELARKARRAGEIVGADPLLDTVYDVLVGDP